MKTLKPEKIKRFKDRLLKKNASLLMQKGAHNLNPIATCHTDEKGDIIVPTDKIIDFFFKLTDHDTSLTTNEHFSNLHTLFSVFTKEIEGYSFESESQISEKDIQEANTKTTIEYLTKNLIISYFDNIREEETGRVDTDLLDKKLAKLIRISSSGRDYRSLVGNTLEHLVETLENEDSWHKCIQNMNDAAIVCNLVGATLPKIEPTVVSKFIQQAQQEIQKNNEILDKILNTKEMMISQEANLKNYLRSVKKLGLALNQVLNKMNQYFSFAHNFVQLLGLPLNKFIGKENDALLKNLAKFFLGCPEPDADGSIPEPDINYSEIRFRLNKLFSYPELITFCQSFKDYELYKGYYTNLFKLYYDELYRVLNEMISHPDKIQVTKLANCIFELKKNLDVMSLDQDLLNEEKQKVQKIYTSLIRSLNVEQLNELIQFRDDLRIITHDENGQFLEATRKTLVAACYFSLKSIDHKDMKMDEFKAAFQKTLFGYAIHYRPQKIFYQLFFETYIGKLGEATTNSFQELANTNKLFVIMMLKVLSDSKTLGQLLPQKYLEYAEELFFTYKENPDKV